MTESAFGVRRTRGFRVARAKRHRVIEGPFGQRVIARLAPGCDLCVTYRTFADSIFVACAIRFVAHRTIPHRRYVELRDGSLLIYPRVTGLAGYSAIAIIGQVFSVREFQVSPHHGVARCRRRIIHIHYLRRRVAASNACVVRVHDKAAQLMIVGIILLFRLVTTHTVCVLRVRAEVRFDFGYRVTNSAFLVGGECGFLATCINLMAGIAINPAAHDLCHLAFDAQMKLVRKVEQDRARLFIIRKPGHPWHLILRNVRVADSTEFFLGYLRLEPLLVACVTRIVTGPGER